MSSERELWLPDEAATVALGRALGERLRAGDTLALGGDLGAGKTCLVRGVAVGLGIDDPEAVQSPTYLLVMEHPGPTPLLHVDAYLPDKTRAFLADGGETYLFDRNGVVAVEWAERIGEFLPARTLWLRLEPGSAGRGGRIARVSDPTGAFPWIEKIRGSGPPA